MEIEDLTQKTCRACEWFEKPMSLKETVEYIKKVNNWEIDDSRSISKEFEFKNFREALEFVNKVGILAEKEGHHLDINLYKYRKVKINPTTHAINELSENDFILASKIDEFN
ncbi:MAG: 4a-hydroxytetrahydrobiopterin dehydratase [Nanoarchaeota archaeon]